MSGNARAYQGKLPGIPETCVSPDSRPSLKALAEDGLEVLKVADGWETKD